MAGRSTIKDVAKKAGCSIATVSMVLNNKNVSIPQDTRDKVIEAARSVNYRPNSLAVGLIRKCTNVLGLIVPDSRSLYSSILSHAIEEAAYVANYSLLYGNTNNRPHRDMEYLRAFVDRQVDGIVYVISRMESRQEIPELVQFVKRNAVPLVAVDRAIPDSGFPTVQMDHEKAGYLATRHLLELGHRRIGYCMSPGFLASSMERAKGYRAALEEFGLPFDAQLQFIQTSVQEEDIVVYEQMLARRITAVLMVNDLMALGFYRFARKNGIRIPQDISVVGSDDSVYADVLAPALTTIRQPVQDIGKTAVRELLECIRRKDECQTDALPPLHQFEPQLIVRGSTGRCGAV